MTPTGLYIYRQNIKYHKKINLEFYNPVFSFQSTIRASRGTFEHPSGGRAAVRGRTSFPYVIVQSRRRDCSLGSRVHLLPSTAEGPTGRRAAENERRSVFNLLCRLQ